MIDKVCHHIVWKGTIPCYSSTLSIDLVLGARQVVQQVEGFYASNELAFEERLTDGCIDHKVIGIEG